MTWSVPASINNRSGSPTHRDVYLTELVRALLHDGGQAHGQECDRQQKQVFILNQIVNRTLF